jgi:hypothetical protein
MYTSKNKIKQDQTRSNKIKKDRDHCTTVLHLHSAVGGGTSTTTWIIRTSPKLGPLIHFSEGLCLKGLVRRAKLKKIFLWEASEKSGKEKSGKEKSGVH